MSDKLSFAQQIRERYPEGLTGLFAIGGTRTTYILEQNRHQSDPGKITDFPAHGEYLLRRYFEIIQMFFDLGGQHMIVSAFSFRGFHDRGGEYPLLVTQELRRFISPEAIAFYQQHDIDPYIVGLDPLDQLYPDHPIHAVKREFIEFQQQWPYRPERRKLFWEVASMPLYSVWQITRRMTPEQHAALDAEIAQADHHLETINRIIYRHYSRLLFGVEIPIPHFYLGTNKSGDLKIRSAMGIGLSAGEYMRAFYLPYPSLSITRETFQAILEDLAFKKRFHAAKTDYSGQYTTESVQEEYDRVQALSATPDSVLGYIRKALLDD